MQGGHIRPLRAAQPCQKVKGTREPSSFCRRGSGTLTWSHHLGWIALPPVRKSTRTVCRTLLMSSATWIRLFKVIKIALSALSEINRQTPLRTVGRLPTYLQHRWRRCAARLRENTTTLGLADLVNFTSLAAREVASSVYGNLGAVKKPEQLSKRSSRGFYSATATTNSQTQKTWCPACSSKNCHTLFRCEAFKAMKPQKRFEMAQNSRLCYDCLKTGHSSEECRSENICAAPGSRLKHIPNSYTSAESAPGRNKKRGHQGGTTSFSIHVWKDKPSSQTSATSGQGQTEERAIQVGAQQRRTLYLTAGQQVHFAQPAC